MSAVFNGQLDSRTGNALPDVVIRSSDNIYFAVHARRLLSTSKNGFANLLTANPSPTTTSPAQIVVAEPADVLNVVLHTVYELSADAHRPSLQCLRATLQALEKYNITPLDQYITTDTPLFNTILALATAHPFETFGLASQYKLEALAVAVSSRTLTTKMHTMNADVAGTINVMYLQRLYGLHQARRDGMKAINATPILHDNLPNCGNAKQQETWLDFQYACGTLFMAAPGECVSGQVLECL